MSEIRNLTRNGETFYPLTHVDAIVSNTGSGIDDVPTIGSDNPVKSGGIYNTIFENLYNASDFNSALNGAGNIRTETFTNDWCVTPFIYVGDKIPGVTIACGANTTVNNFCCYDENKNFITNYWWNANRYRYINFERGTESGARVRYVRCSMYMPAITDCFIEDNHKNLLWTANITNKKSPLYKPFSTILLQGVSITFNDDNSCVAVIGRNPNLSCGWINFESAVGEFTLFGKPEADNGNNLVYNLPNFGFLVARFDSAGNFLNITQTDATNLLKDDVLLLYVSYKKAYGPFADELHNEMVSENKKELSQLYNSDDINRGLQQGNVVGANDYLVTPFIDVSTLDRIWYNGGATGSPHYIYNICCYDENKVFITDYWWSLTNGRYIDFERSTESGARVKYVRATMYMPNLRECCIRESQTGNVLWESLYKSNTELTKIEDLERGYPPYYYSYLNTIENKICEKILTLGQRNDTFFFFTDTHTNYLHSGQIIGNLMKRTNINKAVFGGDIAPAYGGREDLIEHMKIYTNNWYKYINPYGDLYSIRGNHDFTIKTSASENTGMTFSVQSVRNFFMERQSNSAEMHYDDNNPESIYFYIDNVSQKIRFIFLDTTDTISSESDPWGTRATFSKPQSDWCYSAISQAPSGYGVVVIGHIPACETNAPSIQTLADFLGGFKNKESVTVNSTVYDFTNVSTVLLFMLAGHEHRDDFVCYKNVPYFITACDAHNRDYKQGQFGEPDDYPDRAKGTIYEQVIDAVFLDIEHSSVQFMRIGGGYDRNCHFNIIQVSVGGTVQLQTSITSPEWLDCDGTGNYYGGWDPSTGSYVYENRHTKVSVNNGVVTGLAKGNALVCARNRSTLTMEIWCIEVI